VSVGILSLWITIVSSVQIIRFAMGPPSAQNQIPPGENCRDGVRRLLDSVETVRDASAKRSLPEREALRRFRSDIQESWASFGSVRALCQQAEDKPALLALRSIELLRYAEERAVRWGAVDLVRYRRKTPELVRALKPASTETRAQ
jgi:hypothetical protein